MSQELGVKIKVDNDVLMAFFHECYEAMMTNEHHAVYYHSATNKLTWFSWSESHHNGDRFSQKVVVAYASFIFDFEVMTA